MFQFLEFNYHLCGDETQQFQCVFYFILNQKCTNHDVKTGMGKVRPADSSKRDSMCGPLKSPETLEYFKFPLYGWQYLTPANSCSHR